MFLIANHCLVIEDGETKFTLSLERARKLRRFLDKNYQSLRPHKLWHTCPHEDHADDCTCERTGGKR